MKTNFLPFRVARILLETRPWIRYFVRRRIIQEASFRAIVPAEIHKFPTSCDKRMARACENIEKIDRWIEQTNDPLVLFIRNQFSHGGPKTTLANWSEFD